MSSPRMRRLSTRALPRHGWSPADPARRPVLLLNPRSGGGAATRAGLVDLARDRGIEVVGMTPGQDLRELADQTIAGGADALGMAGGDGSLAVVAAAAAAHGLPFVCVPAGTRNHFALDLGVDPLDAPGALDAFSDGLERRIDMGDVNGRPFLNNVSLGVYGEAVRQSAYRQAKARTLLGAAARVLGPSGQAPELHLVDDAGREHTRLAVVLVSNNPYALEGPAPGTRPSLDSGTLGILLLDAPGNRHPPGRAWSAPDFEVDLPAPVHAGIDGESAMLSEPLLRCILRPAVLRVRVSSGHAGAARSARVTRPGY
jgi:diacylglycerol kinase family enzyme